MEYQQLPKGLFTNDFSQKYAKELAIIKNRELEALQKKETLEKENQERWEKIKLENKAKKEQRAKVLKALPTMKNITAEYIFKQIKNIWEKQNQKDFILNEENKSVVTALCFYFSKNENFSKMEILKKENQTPSLSKGLFLYGAAGTGKTALMNAFQLLGNFLHQRFMIKELLFRQFNCRTVANDYMDQHNPYRGSIQHLTKGTFYFDDLGTEAIAYGNYNVMENILEERYSNQSKTFITSNLNLDQINEKYGFRVRDRFNEMFNIISLDGSSFRK